MSESAAAALAGGGKPPEKPNDNGKKEEKGSKPSYGRCAACGNYAHPGPCWRPCPLCGIRHNLRKACPRGANQRFSGGLPANAPAIPPSPFGIGPGFGGGFAGPGTEYHQAAMAHLGAFLSSSLAAYGTTTADPLFATAPAGVKEALVEGPRGKSAETPAEKQPPDASESISKTAKAARNKRRRQKKQRRLAEKEKEAAEGKMDLDNKATQGEPKEPKSPGDPAEPVEKLKTS
ncbi:MAG: hypothetical protein L6R35_006767 [Caloplaca aegaea]|nr:MAG: hypothetical protein L6R35_006767 [Caloplaca aegaea]